MKKTLFSALFLALYLSAAHAQIISTICGNGVSAFSGDNGQATAAQTNPPYGITLDAAGDIYFADGTAYIRKINVTTGIITSVVGGGPGPTNGNGGPATAARLVFPQNMSFDVNGHMFIADSWANYIRKVINPTTIISTVAGDGGGGYFGDGFPAVNAHIFHPTGTAVDALGNIYIADQSNHRIRRVNPAGTMSTVAGNSTFPATFSGDGGLATAACLNEPTDILLDPAGNLIFTDRLNSRIRKIDPAGFISTIAGAGTSGTVGDNIPATDARLFTPWGLVMDGSGNIYFADQDKFIRKIDASGIITTVVGSRTLPTGFSGDYGHATNAQLNGVKDVAVDALGNLYITDMNNKRIRKVAIDYFAPQFVAGHSYSLTLCSSGSISVSSILDALDPEPGQMQTWSLVAAPANGTASASYSAVSTGSVMSPSGATYTPTPGYTGPDSFKVSVADPVFPPDTITVYIMVYGSITPITGSPVVCGSSPVTMSNSTGGGTWSSSSTAVATIGSSDGVVSGVSTGTSDITYSLSPGCFTTTSISVSTATISGTSAVCAGTGLALVPSVIGGTWTSGNTAVATVDPVLGTVSTTAAGTATMSYSISGGCTVTTVVTVNPIPAAITGTRLICGTNTTTLSSPGTTGTWTSNPTTTASVNATTGIVTGLVPGTASITYSAAGCTTFQTVTVGILSSIVSGPKTRCLGGNGILTNTTTGGAWSSSNTAVATVNSSGSYTGVGAGTAIISYTLNGCVVPTTVTINALPAISGPSVLCQYSTVSFTETLGLTGTWSTGSGAVATITSGGSLTGTGPGGTNVIFTSGAGCVSSTSVTVNATPDPITGITGVCQTLTTVLSDNTTGANWSSGNTVVATVNSSGVVTGVNAATALISYTFPTTGCAAITTVTVHPRPNISGPSQLCDQAFATLTTGLAGAWTSSNTTVATVSSLGGFSAHAPGPVTVTFTTTVGGCVNTRAITVNPNPGPISGTMSMCAGASVSLSDATGGGTWTSMTTSIATIGSTTGYATGVSAGTVPVSYVDPFTGCYATTNITVHPQPAVSGPSQVCEFASITITETTATAGTWVSTPAATVTIGGVVTGVSAGTADLTYTATSGGCFATKTVMVNPLPAAITGAGSICAGATTSLSSATVGGVWGSLNTAIANVASTGIASGVVTGSPLIATTTITYRIPATNCSTAHVLNVNPQPVVSGPSAVCTSASIALFEATGTAGAWNSGTPAVATITGTGTVAGIIAGTSLISYTALAGGCVGTKTVTVNPVPAPITGTTTFCQRTVTSLTDADPGGVWSSASGAVTVSGSGGVTGVLPGTPVISYTFPTGCYATTTLTIIAAPVVSVTAAGPTSFCPGGSVVLTASPGFTYQWYNGSSPIGSATGISYTASGSGTYAVLATNASGCTTMAPAVTVVSGAAPVTNASGPLTFCYGNNLTLTANTGSATGTITYQWQLNGVDMPSETSISLNVNSGGIYTCRVTIVSSIGTCTGTTPSSMVIVNPLPMPVIHKSGDMLVTDDHSYASYQWYINTTPISGANSWSVPQTYVGSYRLGVTDANECTGYSSSIYYNPATVLNVAQVTADDIRIWPNPAADVVYISAPAGVRAVIATIDGRTIADQRDAREMSIAKLPAGLYMLSVYDQYGNRIKTEKLVKE